jgi:hypothetical protein
MFRQEVQQPQAAIPQFQPVVVPQNAALIGQYQIPNVAHNIPPPMVAPNAAVIIGPHYAAVPQPYYNAPMHNIRMAPLNLTIRADPPVFQNYSTTSNEPSTSSSVDKSAQIVQKEKLISSKVVEKPKVCVTFIYLQCNLFLE